MYRLVIVLDVEARSPKDAYTRVRKEMKKLDCATFQWESTDEWYDEEGEAIPVSEIQDICSLASDLEE